MLRLLIMIGLAAIASAQTFDAYRGLLSSPACTWPPASLSQTITSITRSANTVTASIASSTGYYVGSYVYVTGVSDSSFNATSYPPFRVTAAAAGSVSWTQTGTNATSSGGSLMAAHFYSQKIGNRWWLCTPLGNRYWISGMFATNLDNSTNYQGFNQYTYIQTKYASGTQNSAVANWAETVNQRLVGYGYNAHLETICPLLPYCVHDFATGDGTPPTKLPYVVQSHMAAFSSIDRYGGIVLPVKNNSHIYKCTFYCGFNNGFADVFDTGYVTFGTWYTQTQNDGFYNGLHNDFLISYSPEEADQTAGFHAGPEFQTLDDNVLTNNNDFHPTMMMMAEPAFLSSSGGDGGYPAWPTVYYDTKVYGKVELANWLQGLTDPMSGCVASRMGSVVTFTCSGHPYNYGDVLTVASCSDGSFNTAAGAPATVLQASVTTNTWQATYPVTPSGTSATGCAVHTGPGYGVSSINTAWGANYDSLGTDATTYTDESIGTGNGSTTSFSATLAHATGVTPFSLQIRVNGVPIAGDDAAGPRAGTPTSSGGFQSWSAANVQGTWASTTAYPAGFVIVANSAVHMVKLAGTSGGSAPSWATGLGQTTTDNGVTWVNLGSAPLIASTSTINYSTGIISLSFAAAPANGIAITVSYQTNGWGVGHGFLDEDGLCPAKTSTCWIPADVVQLSGATAGFKADIANFDYHYAKQYSKATTQIVNTVMPGVMSTGVELVGGKGCPPSASVLKAIGEYIDLVMMQTVPPNDPNNVITDKQARIDFITTHMGDRPYFEWQGDFANNDSFMAPWYLSGSVATGQSSRGSQLSTWINNLWNLTVSSGAYSGSQPNVGYGWWDYYDMRSETRNWGIATLRDNIYDGAESCAATGTDSYGYATGGEQLAATWQANHAYAAPITVRAQISGQWYQFATTSSGTSAGSTPAWTTGLGDTVSDNDITWTGTGIMPSTACYGDFITPVATANLLWTAPAPSGTPSNRHGGHGKGGGHTIQ